MAMNNKPAAKDIIDDESQAELIHFADQVDDGLWGIGRKAVALADELTYEGEGGRRYMRWFFNGEAVRLPAQTLWDAVGRFCGKSGQTVRGYEFYARRVPKRVEKAFPRLTFSHHKRISDAVSGNLAAHELLCQEVDESSDEFDGGPMPISVLGHFLQNSWAVQRARMYAAAEKLEKDERADTNTRSVARYVVVNLT